MAPTWELATRGFLGGGLQAPLSGDLRNSETSADRSVYSECVVDVSTKG